MNAKYLPDQLQELQDLIAKIHDENCRKANEDRAAHEKLSSYNDELQQSTFKRKVLSDPRKGD